MNKEINLGNLSVLGTPSLITLPKEYIVRNEKCPLCKVSLHETFERKSDAPKDIMKVKIGFKYASWLESKSIFCPNCKMKFEHDATDSKIIGRYQTIAEQGGIYKLALTEDFLVSQYDTPLKKNLDSGSIVYTTIRDVNLSYEKPKIYKIRSEFSFSEYNFKSNFLFKLKEGYEKSDGFTEGTISFRKVEAWEEVSAITCAMEAAELFTSENKVTLPAAILTLPKSKVEN
jgi:hypothetical protein